jgi:hypothetical protein
MNIMPLVSQPLDEKYTKKFESDSLVARDDTIISQRMGKMFDRNFLSEKPPLLRRFRWKWQRFTDY